MAVRLSIVFSGDLDAELDRVAHEDSSTKAEILRKALQLYLAARQGVRQGFKFGLVDSATELLETEIVGL